MIRKVLIADRGEVAHRIIRTLRETGISSVAVYDGREIKSLYVTEADESFSLGNGPLSETFLNSSKIISIAKESGADAIHPGYGFLSENAEFAKKIIEAGLIFIGPSPDAIKIMGDKFQALQLAKNNGIAVIPGYYGTPDEILRQVTTEDFPLLIKASMGGGGKAMRIARSVDEIKEMLKLTSSESGKYFGNSAVYAEKYLPGARHVEVQLLGDQQGNVIHLFERECTVQRRYQKVIEESPAIFLSPEQRNKIIADALQIAGKVEYYSAGTAEFLIDSEGQHYFLEMNTRVQVEHAVTEMITGIDIVKEQINIAAGNPLPDYLYHIQPDGHAIEVRVYAEDTGQNFRPAPGEISFINFPVKENLRIEHSIKTGDSIFPDYDPLIAKIVIRGKNRDDAIARMITTLSETTIHGIQNNISLLDSILTHQAFIENTISTGFLNSELSGLILPGRILEEEKIEKALAGLYLSFYTFRAIDCQTIQGYWRMYKRIQCQLDGKDYDFLIEEMDNEHLRVRHNDEEYSITCKLLSGSVLDIVYAGRQANQLHYSWKSDDPVLFIGKGPNVHTFTRNDFLRKQSSVQLSDNKNIGINGSKIRAPLSGRVIKVNFKENELAEKGDTMLVIESMKMENEIKLPRNGKVKNINVSSGIQVHEGDLLLEMDYD